MSMSDDESKICAGDVRGECMSLRRKEEKGKRGELHTGRAMTVTDRKRSSALAATSIITGEEFVMSPS